jgi:hypothetical protein
MQVKIKNMYLQASGSFLYELSLRGKQSRYRSKLVKILNEKLKELAEDELNLIKEYTGEDKDGNPIKNEQGSYDVSDVEKFKKEQQELLDEEAVIEGEGNREMIKTVKQILSEYDGEVSGKEADAFDYLYDAFAVDGDLEGGEK